MEKEIKIPESKIPGWLSEIETQQMLGCRGTKLWQMRSKGLLKSSKFGSKTFYRLSSIIEILEKNASK
jgi:hypothetical protein